MLFWTLYVCFKLSSHHAHICMSIQLLRRKLSLSLSLGLVCVGSGVHFVVTYTHTLLTMVTVDPPLSLSSRA